MGNKEKQIEKFLRNYGIVLTKYDLIVQALTHTSYANENKVEDNERLEFLGDAVLQLYVSDFLYKTYPNYPEGELTKLRAKHVCEAAAAEYALKSGVDQLILLGKGEEASGGRLRPAVLADSFEALLGALFLTAGVESAKAILQAIVFPQITSSNFETFTDHKSMLQELIQSESRKELQYRLDFEEGPPHDRTFKMSVYLDDIKLGEGIGKSKKEASQEAAKAALSLMVRK
ncbi:MAG TPA: ribonuclease III [Bacilli bacterium]|nr:ribonuclease III [Bacilli bacterium]